MADSRDMVDPRDVVGGSSQPSAGSPSSPPSFNLLDHLPVDEAEAASPPSETNWSAVLSLSPEVAEDIQGEGVQELMAPAVKHGKGKSLMKGSRPLRGCIRGERDTPTPSEGEETASDRPENSGNSGDEEGEKPNVPSTSGRLPVAKSRKKPNSMVREGCSRDKLFPMASVIPPNKWVREPGWISDFWEELVGEGFRDDDKFSRDTVGLIAPSFGDRALDHEKGLCVYWKMPKCGFQLALTNFERKLLKTLDITPAQLTAAAWCTIVSFEYIFETFKKELGNAVPTVPLLGHFFTVAITSDDYLAVKRKPKVERLFTEKNPRISRVDSWNEGWAYIPHPERVESLQGIRKDWKPMKLGEKTQKHSIPSDLSAEEEAVAKKLVTLVRS